MFDWIQSAATSGAELATAIVLLTSGVLATSRRWPIGLGALAVQYVVVMLLTATVLPAQVALVKLAAGWAACAILLLTSWQVQRTAPPAPNGASPLRFLPFRIVAVVMVTIVAAEASGRPGFRLPGLSPEANAAVFFLIALSLLHLGLVEEPVFTGMGLLTFLSGFGLFYAAVEPSLAVTALLAGVDLSVALAVSYAALLALPGPAAEPDSVAAAKATLGSNGRSIAAPEAALPEVES